MIYFDIKFREKSEEREGQENSTKDNLKFSYFDTPRVGLDLMLQRVRVKNSSEKTRNPQEVEGGLREKVVRGWLICPLFSDYCKMLYDEKVLLTLNESNIPKIFFFPSIYKRRPLLLCYLLLLCVFLTYMIMLVFEFSVLQ